MPKTTEIPGFAVIGMSTRTTNEDEMSGDGGKIGLLWKSFMHGGSKRIPGVLDPTTILSVYTNYESDHNGAYDVVLGASVSDPAQAPADLRAITIPDAEYVVFPAKSNAPQDIQAAWMGVHQYFDNNPHRPRAFTADFERYSCSGVELCIAVR